MHAATNSMWIVISKHLLLFVALNLRVGLRMQVLLRGIGRPIFIKIRLPQVLYLRTQHFCYNPYCIHCLQLSAKHSAIASYSTMFKTVETKHLASIQLRPRAPIGP